FYDHYVASRDLHSFPTRRSSDLEKGYRVVYEPKAFAIETASENVKEELKRKIRIAAGGMQAIFRLRSLLNPFKFPVLCFQYISRSEEHTSELQSRENLVCRLLLE